MGAVISVALEMLGSLLSGEVKLQRGVDDKAAQLEQQRQRLDGFVKDAEVTKKENDREIIRTCISQARKFVQQAKDLDERYASKVASHRARVGTSTIKKWIYFFDECLTRHRFVSDIESLNAHITDLITSFQVWGVTSIMDRTGGGSTSRQQPLTLTHSRVVEDLEGGDEGRGQDYIPSIMDSTDGGSTSRQQPLIRTHSRVAEDLEGEGEGQDYTFSQSGLQYLKEDNFDSEDCDIKVTVGSNLEIVDESINQVILEELDEFIKRENNLTHLRLLSLEINKVNFHSKRGSVVLKNLFSCSGLKYLHIIESKGLSMLPEHEPGFLPNLRTLKLEKTAVGKDLIRTLEKLTNLTEVWVQATDPHQVTEMTFHANGFPRLKRLSLWNFRGLKHLLIEEGAMPNLDRLVIDYCKELEKIPDGLRFITTLKELEIRDMSDQFKRRFRDKNGRPGQDFDQVRHVPNVRFR